MDAERWLLEYMFIDNPLRDIFVGGYPSRGRVPSGPGLDLDLVDKYTVR